MMEKYLVIHYGEIGLKGKNRPYFEKKLTGNLKKLLKSRKIDSINRIYGRILAKLESGADTDAIEYLMKNIFGVAYFSFAVAAGLKIDEIIKNAVAELKNKKFKTFKVDTKRSNKNFPKNSQQINEEVGEKILKHFRGISVDLDQPDVTVYIEVVEKFALIYFEKIKGRGGLPVGVSGKVVSLISSGIDSPVASFRIMKRGAEIIYIHFHAYPQTSKESIKNVEEIINILNQYQYTSKIYFVPFLSIQKEIVKQANVADRVILYRRMMFRIAEDIALKNGAEALLTGESLAQVASQTITNIKVINESTKLPVFRPLIGYDKEEVVKEAKNIGTFEHSIKPYDDCCSLFVPVSPNTRANIEEIREQEERIKLADMIKQAIDDSEIKIIK